MITRKARWFAIALSIFGGTPLVAQEGLPPAPIVSKPLSERVVRPDVVVTPPTIIPVTTVTTLEPGSVSMLPAYTTIAAPAPTNFVQPMPTANYMVTPYFGYYQTQWRPFPTATPAPMPTHYTPAPVYLMPRESVNVPVVIPPAPRPMPLHVEPTPTPMKPEPIPVPTPMKTEPPAPMKLDPPTAPPIIPPTPSKPLLLDQPKANPLGIAPVSTNPTPPELREQLPPLPALDFSDVKKPLPVLPRPTVPEPKVLPPQFEGPMLAPVAHTEPAKKLATLGVPKPMEVKPPIIRSAIKADSEIVLPIIRNGPGK